MYAKALDNGRRGCVVVVDDCQLKIRVASGGSVNFLATLLTPVYMDLYAPDSPITIAVGVNHYYGRLIGKSLDIALPVLGVFTEESTTADPKVTRLVQ